MNKFWKGKRVFITGHTGFKGSWLSLWLQTLGSEVIGYALQPPTTPSLFDVVHVGNGMISLKGDILDYSSLQSVLHKHKPDIVIHMAAQSLVRHSYKYPVETLSTNIIGTANVLEAVRHTPEVRVVINVTSDKCYENREWMWGYRESDPIGGHDPYSCSKGCAELVISSYRRSYFSAEHTGNIASVRAGNVIGGGDWATDRIVPDCIRALHQEQAILLRNPHSIRPWQHVLEPLAGYMLLAQKLWEDGEAYADGWNFGPNENHAWSVGKMVDVFCCLWGQEAKWYTNSGEHPHEAHYLKLDSSKAMQRLGWRPVLNMQDTLWMTVDWYKRYFAGEDPKTVTLAQIEEYQKKCKENGDVR